jgi:hypothetical protein
MLHIVNGESTAETLRRTNIKGEIFSFKDTLINGPSPAVPTADEWRAVRVQHLVTTYGLQRDLVEQEFLAQEAKLRSAAKHDEIVLWFEHDLFCQLNLMYLLDWFNNADSTKTELSLINIGEFPGRKDFRGLGELTADELASLFPKRERITDAHLSLASRSWQAFRSSDPTRIELLLGSDTSALPFLSASLTAHLERFPSTENGLGRVEQKCLKLIADGLKQFSDLFSQFWAQEKAYGLGDAQLWSILVDLSTVSEPPFTMSNASSPEFTPEAAKKTSFEITKSGYSVLSTEADFISLNGIDQWLGGVHLSGKQKIWRWHNVSRRLVLA